MIANFENAASHKYNAVQTAKSLWTARSEMTGYSFLVIKNHINSILKSPIANNFCRLLTAPIHPVVIMAAVWPPEISIVHGLRLQLFLNQTLEFFWNRPKLYFSLKLLSVLPKQLAYS